MARDYFHFVTKFFAVIDVSASHIYHSALVVSPQSSVIREHYYCKPFWHARPRVLFGLPNSWDQAMILQGHYTSHAWSPCGQYFSTLSQTSVQEWNAATLEKHSNLQPHTATRTVQHTYNYSPGALAYSPDGASLACFFDSVIVIWDLQTGGVINEIEINSRYFSSTLVWSSDGTAIYTPSRVEDGAWVVTAYNITSGTEVHTSRVQSSTKPYLWLHGTSLWVMEMVDHKNSQTTINIHEIQPNSINNLLESFPVNKLIKPLFWGTSTSVSFSPSTYQISTITAFTSIGTLRVLDIRSSKPLLQREGCLIASGSCFSPGGSLLVASDWQCNILVWEYTPEQGYTLLRNLPGDTQLTSVIQGYQFSSSSTLLLSFTQSLEVHLESLRPNLLEINEYYTGFFNSGTCFITASCFGSTLTSINLQKGSSQCIDTKFKIHGLAITGSILLVQGEDMVVGWKLTIEGIVDKVLDSKSGNCDGRLWTKPMSPDQKLHFSIHNNVVAIKASQDSIYYYDKETGVELAPITTSASLCPRPFWENFKFNQPPNSYPFLDINQPLLNITHHSNDNKAWLQEGWVKPPKGEYQHQFWLPPKWRHNWVWSYWIEDDTTTLLLMFAKGPPVIIKF